MPSSNPSLPPYQSTDSILSRLSDVIGCYLGRRGPSCQVDSSSWEFLDQNICSSSTNTRAEDEDPLQRQIRLNSEAADILARGANDVVSDTREGSISCSSGDSVYHTGSNLTNTTTGNSSAGEVEHSRSPKSVSKEKLLETSEDDTLGTSQELIQTNIQKETWNSSLDHVSPPSLPRGSAGSSHVVRSLSLTVGTIHFLSPGVEAVLT